MLKDVTGLDKQKYCDFIKLEIISKITLPNSA